MTALVLVLALSLPAPGSARTASPQAPVNPDAKAQADFLELVNKYLGLHKKLEGELPRLPDQADAEAIQAYQVALGKKIADARVTAKPGEIFTPPIRNVFRRLIRSALKGPDAKTILHEVHDENTRFVPLRVNGPYPEEAPLSTVPARLLQALPRLPEDIEYRFVGRRLILFDRDAQIIVDYMTNALP